MRLPKVKNTTCQSLGIMKLTKYTSIIAITALLLVFSVSNKSIAEETKYEISPLPNGGYSVDIVLVKRHWKPITAEGFFPIERKTYKFEIIGKGEDWSNRNPKGFYYSTNEIISKRELWDLGYAWVDPLRKYIYFNFYWVSAPDEIIPSDINGKYPIATIRP